MTTTIAGDLSFAGAMLIAAAILLEPTRDRWLIIAGALSMSLGAALDGRWLTVALFLAVAVSPLAVALWAAWRARPRS